MPDFLSGLVAVLIAALAGVLWLSVPTAWILLLYAPGGPPVSPSALFAGLSLFSIVCARLALALRERR